MAPFIVFTLKGVEVQKRLEKQDDGQQWGKPMSFWETMSRCTNSNEGLVNFCETMTKITNNKQKGGAIPFLKHHDQDDKQQARKRGEGFLNHN